MERMLSAAAAGNWSDFRWNVSTTFLRPFVSSGQAPLRVRKRLAALMDGSLT
jgi:hypothetical protein